MSQKSYLILTGGLGNQLFGIAAALHFQTHLNHKIILDCVLGKPRQNILGRPEVFSMAPSLHQNLQIENTTFVQYRSFNYLLRQTGHDIQSRRFAKQIIQRLTESVITQRFKDTESVFLDKVNRINEINQSCGYVFIGYFQNQDFFTTEGFAQRQLYEVTQPPRPFGDYWGRVSEVAKPLIVHIRRDDYIQESFGLLSKRYYSDQLEKIKSISSFKEVWIFTDDEKSASKVYPKVSDRPIRVFKKSDYTPSETIQIMRFGEAFVIANSSFSYWAAMLRHKIEAPVIAPNPWFQEGDAPVNLIPNSWIKSKAYWDAHSVEHI